MNFDPMNFVDNLYYMGVGMACIVIVIGVIILLTILLNKGRIFAVFVAGILCILIGISFINDDTCNYMREDGSVCGAQTKPFAGICEEHKLASGEAISID